LREKEYVLGKIVSDAWNDLPHHYPYIILDEFTIMPDHVHGIITIVGEGLEDRTRTMNINADPPLQVHSTSRFTLPSMIPRAWLTSVIVTCEPMCPMRNTLSASFP